MMIGGGWLDQVGIRLTQLSTGLKVEAELGNNGENSGPLTSLPTRPTLLPKFGHNRASNR